MFLASWLDRRSANGREGTPLSTSFQVLTDGAERRCPSSRGQATHKDASGQPAGTNYNHITSHACSSSSAPLGNHVSRIESLRLLLLKVVLISITTKAFCTLFFRMSCPPLWLILPAISSISNVETALYIDFHFTHINTNIKTDSN